MEFKVINIDSLKLKEKKSDKRDVVFIFGVFEGEEASFLKKGNLAEFDFLYKRIKQVAFKAKKNKSIIVESPMLSIVQGMGKKGSFTYDSVRLFISGSLKIARENHIKEAVVILPVLPDNFYVTNGLFYLSSAVAEGAGLGLYEFKKYITGNSKNGKPKSENKSSVVSAVNVFFNGKKLDNKTIGYIEDGFGFGQITSDGSNFSRDLVNEPGNVATPDYLASIAAEIAAGDENITCEVFNEKDIQKKGMHAFFGVGQGSKNPPRFIHITYKPRNIRKNSKVKRIAIVGKGITFDSGGLSLKPSDYMVNMKSDKSGACAVLGIMKYISSVKACVEVHGIIAACENMPDGGAQRPDDVVKAFNGKTIEIENTDAEGRLTLADALGFAGSLKVDEIIDMATLTGACVVALGEYTSGVMGNDTDLIRSIISVSEISGERMWELPFDDNMKEKLSSPIADIKNVGNRYGGAITAGMFLQEFVPENIKWCHIDIAGPAFTKTGFLYNPKGATGVGVRTLLYYLKQYSG